MPPGDTVAPEILAALDEDGAAELLRSAGCQDVHWLTRTWPIPVGYVVGTFPTALLVAKAKGVDILAEGSGNPGASNVARSRKPVGYKANAMPVICARACAANLLQPPALLRAIPPTLPDDVCAVVVPASIEGVNHITIF